MPQTLPAPTRPATRPKATRPEPSLGEVLAEVTADGLTPLERSFVVAAYLLATAVGRTTFVGECRVVAEACRDFALETEAGLAGWLARLGPAVVNHHPEPGFWDKIIAEGLAEEV